MEGSVMELQVRNTIGIGFLSMDMLGKLNLDFQEPIFTPMELTKPDLKPLLKDIPEVLRLQITQAVQACYSVSNELLNDTIKSPWAQQKLLEEEKEQG